MLVKGTTDENFKPTEPTEATDTLTYVTMNPLSRVTVFTYKIYSDHK